MLRKARFRRCITLFLLILALQVFISPQWPPSDANAYVLRAGIEDGKTVPDVLVEDKTSDEFLPALKKVGFRCRTTTYFPSLTAFKMATFDFLPRHFSEQNLSALDLWNRLVGYELAAAPHADMVARK